MLRITAAQINPTIGDISGNIALMEDCAKKAQAEHSQLLVFPELSLTGYYPGDLLEDEAFQQRISQGFDQLLAITKNYPTLHWVVGLPVLSQEIGKRYRNALMVICNGTVELSYFKQLLPTYNIFDERRHFEPGPDVARVLKIGDTRVGVLICEDGWNDEGHDYAVNPFKRLADAAPDVIVSINASPSNVGKREQRHNVIGSACARHGLPLIYVNQVGGHDQLVYDGASFAVSSKGTIVWEAKRFEQAINTLNFDTSTKTFTSGVGSPMWPVSKEGLSTLEFYRKQIVLGLTDYARRCGFKKVIVGSSGGIDSALTLALAAEALGADNVLAVTMPSEYSSQGSVDDSVTLCNNLGVKLITHYIRPTVESFKAEFQKAAGEPLTGLALENLQARIRGTILMEFSNSFGNLVLTTGNKSELSVGYCTLYGDTNGGLGLIGDLYKTEIFELCRHINKTAGRELIPNVIIDKAPSAELAPGQKDSDSLPPYEVLDEILKVLIEGNLLAPAELATAKARMQAESPDLVAKIKRMIANTEYKRRQAPPILRVRARAFGNGRQVPIAAKHY